MAHRARQLVSECTVDDATSGQNDVDVRAGRQDPAVLVRDDAAGDLLHEAPSTSVERLYSHGVLGWVSDDGGSRGSHA